MIPAHGIIGSRSFVASGSSALTLIASGEIPTSSGISYASLRSAGAVDGDVILFAESNDAGNPVGISGFTTLVSATNGTPERIVSYRVLQSGDTGSSGLTSFSGQTDSSGVYAICRNAGTPNINAVGSGSGSLFQFFDKTTVAGSLLFGVLHLDDDEIGNLSSWSNPSDGSWSKLVVGASSKGSNGSTTLFLHKVAAGGTENPGTLSATGANDAYDTLIVEVPAAA